MQIRNHRYPVLRLEYLSSSGTFVDVPRTDYNYFVKADGMGPGPYTFRVTDLYGHVVTDSGIAPVENSNVSGNGQFPLCP
jgi:expansin (peptidoglycan-binding protein)